MPIVKISPDTYEKLKKLADTLHIGVDELADILISSSCEVFLSQTKRVTAE